MLKFVQKWLRERTENAEIEADNTENKWTKCEDGLPSSDRKVEVMIYGNGNQMTGRPSSMDITLARFNPHVGWEMSKVGVVIAWKDVDKEYRDMINDMTLAKILHSDKL